MKTKITWYIAGCLLILIIAQTLILEKNSAEFHRMPVFLPSSLEFESRLENALPLGVPGDESSGQNQPQQDISIEFSADSLVRGLLSLEEIENLSLSKHQALQILLSLRKMTEKRAQLLKLRIERHKLNESSMDTGILIALTLTPGQLDYIGASRSEATLLLNEEPYWDRLIEILAKETDKK